MQNTVNKQMEKISNALAMRVRQAFILCIVTTALAACATAGSADRLVLAQLDGDLRMAEITLDSGDLVKAVGQYTRMAQKYPDRPEPLIGLGTAYFMTGHSESALTIYQEVLHVSPDNVAGLIGVGRAYLQLDDPCSALSSYRRALGLSQDDVDALNGIGVASDYIGDHLVAQATYRRILDLGPDNAFVENNLALSLVMSGKPTEGVSIFRDLERRNRFTLKIAENMALAYASSGDSASADAIARKALAIAPDEPFVNEAIYQALADVKSSPPVDQLNFHVCKAVSDQPLFAETSS